MCTPNLTNFHQGPPQGPGGYPAPPNAGPRFPTYTPAQQRGPSPPQNLGQRPPNAGLLIFCIPLVRVRKPTLQVGPNSTSRCTLGCINNSSNNRPFTRIMCLRLDSMQISISMSFHASTFQGGNMNPPITMQYHLLPGGGAAHPAAFQPHPNHRAPAPNNVMQVTFLTITETSLV